MLTSVLRHSFSLAPHYALLGLKSTAQLDQVKKRYYQLAKQCHPDVNSEDTQAHVKFAEITKAYKQVISSYGTQQHYFKATTKSNKTQSSGYSQQQQKNKKQQQKYTTPDDYEDLYQYDVFYKQGKKHRKPKVGEDIYATVTVTLEQSILGVHKQIPITRYQPCPACHDKQFANCFSCGGKGEIYNRSTRQKVRCEYCSGRGYKNDCSTCMGASYVLKQATQTVYIQKGTQDKTILKVQRRGHTGFKAHNGDLYLTVVVNQSQKFKVDGNNVLSQHQLDFISAACGGTVRVETVHGPKEIKIQAGTQSGAELRIFNYGLKSPYSKRMGDQIVKFKIKIPDRLSEKQRVLMQKLAEMEQ